MTNPNRITLIVIIFLLGIHRLPAPIQEVPESPTPKPAQAKTTLKRNVKPKPTTEHPPVSQDAKAPTPESKVSPAETTVSSSEQAAITSLLTDLENKWEASIATHAVSTVDSLVAEDYVSVSSTGKVLNKAALLDQLKNDTNVYDFAGVQELSVQVVRPDFAIVTGLTREKGRIKDGKTFDRLFRFTDTWTKRNGQWRCTNAHVAKVSEK